MLNNVSTFNKENLSGSFVHQFNIFIKVALFIHISRCHCRLCQLIPTALECVCCIEVDAIDEKDGWLVVFGLIRLVGWLVVLGLTAL